MLQALGLSWCNVTAADAAFSAHITPGSPHPASSTPERADYSNCLIGWRRARGCRFGVPPQRRM